MWCAILDNRQIQLRDLPSVKDLSTKTKDKKKKKPQGPAREQPGRLSVVALFHSAVGEYISFMASWLEVLDLGVSPEFKSQLCYLPTV